ncbi:MAG: GSCFA domain-containing protein [Muribaculaceae bacterium]|nr:GSCFA domain-containing protein [Muribaculaceae bacterium]
MNFRTQQQPLSGHQGLVDHHRAIVMMGSCFTDNIGQCLSERLFDVDINPYGTLYNPASIAQALLDLLYGKVFKQEDLFEHEGLWHSYSHHSRFSDVDVDKTLKRINDSAEHARESLANASALIITFGTAYVFRMLDDGRLVANCHKLPASLFERQMLDADRIVGLWRKMMREVSARYPRLKVVFTVSPIRHLADGLHGNAVSKATLLLAVERIVNEFPDRAIYFPSYEIVFDDLRDYRFYAEDMTHPSTVAVNYIYEIFQQSFMSADTMTLASSMYKMTRRLKHRYMGNDPLGLVAFEESRKKLIIDLLSQYPFMSRAIKNIKLQ